jgi:uncharacterized membrane protein
MPTKHVSIESRGESCYVSQSWHDSCGQQFALRYGAKKHHVSEERFMAASTETQSWTIARTDNAQSGLQTASRAKPSARARSSRVNVGNREREASLVLGSAVALFGIARRDLPGLLLAALGAGLVYRGASGHCSVYGALGIDSRGDRNADKLTEPNHIEVVESFLVDKSPEELYAFWRKLEHLPSIMSHLESVSATDHNRSHWVTQAPKIAGGSIEWDSEIVEDRPNERIAWRSLPGADVENHGAVEFKRAPGVRGTIVRAELTYSPPAGHIGYWFATLLGEDPESQLREDLRHFKRVMEIGESLTTTGQSRGSCFGGIGRLMS